MRHTILSISDRVEGMSWRIEHGNLPGTLNPKQQKASL